MRTKKKSMRVLLVCLAIIIAIVAVKAIWVAIATRHNGDFVSEKADILARRDYLVEKVITSPQQLIDEMPSAVGPQFQGEWALYSCSMLSAALVNMTLIYGEDKEMAVSSSSTSSTNMRAPPTIERCRQIACIIGTITTNL